MKLKYTLFAFAMVLPATNFAATTSIESTATEQNSGSQQQIDQKIENLSSEELEKEIAKCKTFAKTLYGETLSLWRMASLIGCSLVGYQIMQHFLPRGPEEEKELFGIKQVIKPLTETGANIFLGLS